MCDYSLQHVKSRPAAVGDKLVVSSFGTGTRGFAEAGASDTVVCVLPGTEIAFDSAIKVYGAMGGIPATESKVAVFAQINKEQPMMHHDSIETPDGKSFLLTFLVEGQTATVLQLPAAPKTAEEAKKQERVAFVG